MAHLMIDCRFGGTLTGLGRYTRELIPLLLRELPEYRISVLVRSPHEDWLESISSTAEILHCNIRHYSLKEQYSLVSLLMQKKPDLYFCLHFNLPILCPVSSVITVHDCILDRYPNRASFLRRKSYKITMSNALRKAKKIIAVSAFVKQDILSLYGSILQPKIHVIHEGVHERFQPVSREKESSIRMKYALPQSFYLYVGNTKEHKNVALLFEAFSRLSASHPELVFISDGPELSALLLPPRTHVLRGVPEEDLPGFYSAATAYVSASLYEGFGLPAAEALACGCPVIAVNRSAIPEVTDGHAMLIEPTPEAMASALQKVKQRVEPWRKLQWIDTAQKTASVLRSALQNHQS